MDASSFTIERAWVLSAFECPEERLCKFSGGRSEEEKKAANFTAFRKMY
jgi:hypothetical protein